MDIGTFGPILALGLAAVGSSIGCGISGMASHGVMAKTDEGHGLFVAVSAMPASQTIYGFVLMMLMNGKLAELAQSGKSSAYYLIVGAAVGTALMVSAIYQGKACATSIVGISKKPSMTGMSLIAPAMIESFAIFALVGGIVLI